METGARECQEAALAGTWEEILSQALFPCDRVVLSFPLFIFEICINVNTFFHRICVAWGQAVIQDKWVREPSVYI